MVEMKERSFLRILENVFFYLEKDFRIFLVLILNINLRYSWINGG